MRLGLAVMNDCVGFRLPLIFIGSSREIIAWLITDFDYGVVIRRRGPLRLSKLA